MKNHLGSHARLLLRFLASATEESSHPKIAHGQGNPLTYSIRWRKVWSYSNLIFLVGEMRSFPSRIINLKSGSDWMWYLQEGIWPPKFPMFYNEKVMGRQAWVNFIWSSPYLRAIICERNGHISSARKTRFGYDFDLFHPSTQLQHNHRADML